MQSGRIKRKENNTKAAPLEGKMNPLFFDEQHVKQMTEEILESDLRIGDAVLLLGTDVNIIHHFEEYTGPLGFVHRKAKFTNGRGCSLSYGSYYKILKR